MKLTNVVLPPQYRIIGWGLVVLLLLFLGWLWLQNRDKMQEVVASNAQGQRTDVATSGIVSDIGVATDEAQQDVTGLGEIRDAYQRGYEDAQRTDPAVADFDQQLVPQRLRDLARERRLARERLGCTGDGCGGDGAAEGTGRRDQTR